MKQAGRPAKFALFRHVAFVALWLCVGTTAVSQLTLDFKRAVENRPAVELYFEASCDGNRASFTDKRMFGISEDGLDITDFELWCPDQLGVCRFSVALVLDASGSMDSARNAGAKAAGRAFVDLMDGVNDEACIIWSTPTAVVAQQMTVYRDLLQNAVDGLPAHGIAAVWDGAYTGVMNLINDGVNPCRAVIFMTDGSDISSGRTPDEIIRLAQRNRVHVFAVGLGSAVPSAVLMNIADMTGGRYYETDDPQRLVDIFVDIHKIISDCFQECVITYQPDCPDGTTRQVDLTIKNFCGASVTESRSYTSPRDTKVFEPIRLRLGKVTAHGNEEVVVPLELLDTLSKFTPVFHPAVFIVRFDTSNLRFIDMATPQGSLLENVSIKATPAAGGVTFETMEKKLVDTRTVPALLAELKFLTRDIVDKDTTPCPIWLTDWYFRAGCFTVQPESGEIKVIGKAPSIDCRFDAPESLSVDTVKGSYHPNPFTVTQVIANSGVVAALNPRFKLHVDTTQFALVDPPVDSVQAGVAELQPSDSTSVSWELRAKARPADARHAVSITAHFDNHPHVECGRSIFVPRLPATSAEAPVETSAWSFHLYPDPARGGVSVVLTGAGTDGFSAALYDAVGRLVTTVARDRGAESMPVVFDLHGLPAGVYHVAVYGGGGVKSAKFVKAP